MIDIGTKLNQRFLLEKELGRGGMGAVYSARDEVLDRNVAIKVLKEHSGEEVGKKLRLEAQIAARLLHENVVRIYDFGQADGMYFLIMEQVDGTSLSKRWRRLELAERLRILAQVADALDYAHHQGVIHRDIKPGNVLLNTDDVPKLSDFGLSMLVDQGDSTSLVRGTPHYMSPEQIRAGRLDFRTDLYSLGVMVYESATGSVPFTGTSLSIMSQHVGAEPERPRARDKRISAELESLILALLAKRPEDRPSPGAAVALALREEIERLRAPGSTGCGGRIDGSIQRNGHGPLERCAVHRGSGQCGRDERQRAAATAPLTLTVPQAPFSQATESVPSSAAAGRAQTATLAVQRVAALRHGRFHRRSDRAGPRALARKMLEVVLAEPILITPDERYLYGHYLAYLLSGSRRRGVLSPAHGAAQCGPGPIPPGLDVCPPLQPNRGCDPRRRPTARPEGRNSPCPVSGGSGQVPGLPRHRGQAQIAATSPQGHRRCQRLRPEAADQ